MRKQLILSAAIAGICIGGSAAAYAQFGGLGKAIQKESKKQKEKARKKAEREAAKKAGGLLRGRGPNTVGSILSERDARLKTPKRGGGGGGSISGAPSSNLTSYTKCSSIGIQNVTIGRLGEYTFQQGFSKEERSGFVNRRPGSADGCIITTGLSKDEVLYFEVDRKAYKSRNTSYKLQCVESRNPSGGTVELYATNGTSDQYLKDSYMKLHCGNSEGMKSCASGTNSERATAYSNDMKRIGKYGVSFLAWPNQASKRGQTKRLYCQYYDRNSGQSLVAFEMISKSPYD